VVVVVVGEDTVKEGEHEHYDDNDNSSAVDVPRIEAS
jgi:hypothetical protein